MRTMQKPRLCRMAISEDNQRELNQFVEHFADRGLVLDVANATYDERRENLRWVIDEQPVTADLLQALHMVDFDVNLVPDSTDASNELRERFADVTIAGTMVFDDDCSQARLALDADALFAGIDYAVDMNWLTPSQGKAATQQVTREITKLRDRIADLLVREGTWLMSRLMV